MIVVQFVAELRAAAAERRAAGGNIAFVPTMGNLHAGHLRLAREARQLAATVIASIYVNPLQFGRNEDFSGYPRSLAEDRAALEAEGVDIVFAPPDSEVYPRGLGAQTMVEVPGLSDILCGAFRPGHFRGVTTVVNRLFNLVQPDIAIFGKKDYQQLLLIKLMVADLGMPIDVVGVETVREGDGLALSSRNRYLSSAERKAAPVLYATLCGVRDRLQDSGRIDPDLESAAMAKLADAGFRPDYVAIRRQEDLGVPAAADRQLVILAAARLGRARPIDNIEAALSKQ